MIPPDVRRRAIVAREATRNLVKRRLELQDAAEVAMREAEAALYELRMTVRQWPKRRAG